MRAPAIAASASGASGRGLEPRAHWLLALILVTTAIRLALAATIGLSVDESYAVVMGRRLSLSYFDHPPMVFWWTGLASRIAASESPLVVRLPFIAAFMVTTWLLYRLGGFLFGTRAGLWTAFLLNVSLFLSVAAGGWALPDGPLVLFSAAAAYCLARATIGDRPTPSREPSGSLAVGSRGWWIGFGVSAGLALVSKYHGLLLLAGTGFYLVTARWRATWLRRRDPYIALALAAMTFLPVLVWNATHEWASFRFQGGRAVPLEETGGTTLLDSVAGQAAWTLPWVWVPLLVVLVAALRAGPRDDRRWLLACLASGPILAFTLLAAVGARGLPHWEEPGYFMALPLLGAWFAHEGLARLWARRWLWGCAVGFLLVVLGLATHARTGWLRSAAPRVFARGDPTDDLLEWTPVVQQLRAWGFPRPGSLIAAGRWEDAAKMSYAMGPGVEVTCVGDDPRGFAFTRIPVANLGRDIVLVVRRRAGREPLAAYAAYFDALEFLGNVPIERGGREEITVSVYLGHRLRGPLPLLQRR